MSVIPRALENPSLDDGFWQIRTFAAAWLNGIFWSPTVAGIRRAVRKAQTAFMIDRAAGFRKIE